MVNRMKSKKLADLRVAVSLDDGEDKEVIEEAISLIHDLADQIGELESYARLHQCDRPHRRKKRFWLF